MLPCHGLGCAMTNAKLVYWSGNFYLFCIAKSRVSLTAFIPRVLGIRLHVRTCKSLLCTTFGLLHHSQHILTDAVKHSGDYDEVSRPCDVISG